MALTLADIERWDASAISDVSDALAKRGTSAGEVRTGLSKLPLITSWKGAGGDAARESLDKLATYLSSHGLEMARLSAATGEAAAEIDRIKGALQHIKSDAQADGFSVDMLTGEVTQLYPDRVGDPIYALKQADLMTRIAALLAAANTADADLATAVTSAGGDAAGQDRPEVEDALSQPLPDDPQQFHDLWEKLTSEQKETLFQRDHSIGNRDGMPVVDRDYFNRRALGYELSQAQAAQREVDDLKSQHPDWLDGRNLPPENKPGAIFYERLVYDSWQKQLADASDRSKFLPDLQAVDKTVGVSPDRKLLLLDTHSGERAHAAVAVGNPDTADHVSVTAPGLNTTVGDSLTGMTSEAVNLRQESLRQLVDSPDGALDSVATVAWIGYDAPQIPGGDDGLASLTGAWDTSNLPNAQVGARDLADFYDGLQASHEGSEAPQVTAIGHSYGSLTTGLALQEPGSHGITDAIFYGSPGIEASTPQELQLEDGHVFAMQTPDDPIRHVFDVPPVLHTVENMLPPPWNALPEAGLRTLDLLGTGQFGENPATNPNFTRLETGPVAVPDGDGGTLDLAGAQGHSDYPRFSDNGMPRTTNYNIAAVIAGLEDNAVRAKEE